MEAPNPGPGEVVVAVKATGVCRSDWHGWHGHDPDITSLPHVPGHEFAGVVASVGDGVESATIGDRVAVPFVLGCGSCGLCAAGDPQVCPHQRQPGFTHWGSFAEYVLVPYADNNLVLLPEEIDMEAAASLGCRFTTAYRAVVQQGRVAPDEWVAIFGCGGVGLSAVMCAKSMGARVIGVDTSTAALEHAAALGADRIVPMSADIQLALMESTEGGPHLGVDAIGHPEVIAASIGSLRPRGRHVQVGLLVGDRSPTPVGLDQVISKELEILGSHGASRDVLAGLFESIRSGELEPTRLITKRIGLDDIPQALTRFDDHAPGMVIAHL